MDTIWIGTDDYGIAKFDGINWIIYNDSNSDYLTTCESIAIDGSGALSGLELLVADWQNLME